MSINGSGSMELHGKTLRIPEFIAVVLPITLTITNATVNEDNEQYRVTVAHLAYVCELISDSATLNIRVNTVVTNRKITYRVNKN